MTPTNPHTPFTPLLPTTYDFPKEDEGISYFVTDTFARFADVVNDKKIGTYTQATENLNGESWSYLTTKKTRVAYQTLAYIPSYPNIGTLILTRTTNPQYPIENINPQFVISLSYGTASRPCTAVGAGDGDYITFMNRGDPRIFFDMSDTTITITTTMDMSAYSGFIVVHYIRDGF